MPIYFTITVPSHWSPRDWAKRYWDTYGFDYDTEKLGQNTIFAWPLDSEESLTEALDEDEIPYIKVNIEEW